MGYSVDVMLWPSGTTVAHPIDWRSRWVGSVDAVGRLCLLSPEMVTVRFDLDWTAIRARFDHSSTTYLTTCLPVYVLLHCGL